MAAAARGAGLEVVVHGRPLLLVSGEWRMADPPPGRLVRDGTRGRGSAGLALN
jgi:hypothetical protein